MELESEIHSLLSSSDIELDDPVTAITGVSESSADRYATLGATERTVRDLLRSPVGLGQEVPPQYQQEATIDLLSVSVKPNDVGLAAEANLGLLRLVTAFSTRWDNEDFDDYPRRGTETISKVPYRVVRGYRGSKGMWKASQENNIAGPATVLNSEPQAVGYLSAPVDINDVPYSLLTTATDPVVLSDASDQEHPITRLAKYNIIVISLLLKSNFASAEVYREQLHFTSDPVISDHHSYPWEIIAENPELDLRIAIPHVQGQNSLLKEQVLESRDM